MENCIRSPNGAKRQNPILASHDVAVDRSQHGHLIGQKYLSVCHAGTEQVYKSAGSALFSTEGETACKYPKLTSYDTACK
jgi:hypothetical protein